MESKKKIIRGKISLSVAVLITLLFLASCSNQKTDSIAGINSSASEGYTGSISCRECHENFYKLWSTSFHGLAMQPYTKEFAQKNLLPQTKSLKVQGVDYQFNVEKGLMTEQSAKGQSSYRVEHVMGGKYVYFFLTPLKKGKLQVLPVSYDVRKKTWYDTTSSFIRHFVDTTDRPIDWRNPLLTFNTACYGCHVSQLSTNYDPETDSYKTVWAEPGINCETCHGPGREHNRIAKETPEGKPLKELRIISTKTMTRAQRDATCATCHTKGGPITKRFTPGEQYFDHYDLVTLEHPDFYPDGRDLGENYTYTLWLMSPCVKSGALECLHCHTSSGRYRFKTEKFNDACMPCHKEKVKNLESHTHHAPDGEAGKCIACHMPQTEFARMTRSDHSMRPPMPAATIAFSSPNACNICHKDKNAQWADTFVRKWRTRDYQAPVLYVSHLIDSARKGDWGRLNNMLSYITGKDRDEVYATSLIRLLRSSNDPAILPAIIKASKDTSPLIRSAAIESLGLIPSIEGLRKIIKATGDEYRLVRVHAAGSLAGFQEVIARIQISENEKKGIENAKEELFSFLLSRPDQWSSHYNMGNYHLKSGNLSAALYSYEKALHLEPSSVPVMVNLSVAHARNGQNKKAEELLRKALEIEPKNSTVNYNLGLLLAELGKIEEAEKALRTAFRLDQQLAPAAYNLCVLLAQDREEEAVGFCKKAYELRPDEAKYAYTLAFYQHQKGDTSNAIKVLKQTIAQNPSYTDTSLLLGDIYKGLGKKESAKNVYQKALSQETLSMQDRYRLKIELEKLMNESKTFGEQKLRVIFIPFSTSSSVVHNS